MIKRFLFAISLILIGFTACKKDDDEVEIIIPDLEEYVKANFPDAQMLESGIYVIVTSEGAGPKPVEDELLYVYYKTLLLTGVVVDSIVRQTDPKKPKTVPASFKHINNSYLKGWNFGMAELNKGSKAIILVPDSLAYGSTKLTKIPANSPLRFDVELLYIK